MNKIMELLQNGAPKVAMQRRVAEAALFLDQRIPGWEELIDTSILSMDNSFRCILGQIGSKVRDDAFYVAEILFDYVSFGYGNNAFSATAWASDDLDPIRLEWIEEIEKRRGKV